MSTQTAAGAVLEFDLQDRLRKAREHAGLDQRELAERMGVSRGTVGNSEHGHVAVRPITIRAWALATGVDPVWLATGRSPEDDDGGGVSTEPLTFGSEGWEFESLRARSLSLVA